jgi:hypothetical protein
MVCLQPLFAGDTPVSTIARLLKAKIPPPREVRREVPDDLSRVIMSLLARDREKRPNAEAAIAALVACKDYPRNGRDELVALMAQRFPERAPVRARGSMPLPEKWVPGTPVLSLPPSERTLTPASQLRVSRPRRWPWVLLAVLVAAIATVVAVLSTYRSERPAASSPPADKTISAPISETAAPSVAAPSSAPRSGTAIPPIVPPEPSTTTGSAEPRRATNDAGAASVSPAKSNSPVKAPSRLPPRTSPARSAPHDEPLRDGIQEIHLDGK